ncbi:ABC transporter ATP-binding protein [Spirochaetota bacterium]
MNEKITITGLHKKFNSKVILNGVNLSVYEGEILCIIGVSGSGKSVLMKHLIGIINPDEGTIKVDGVEFTNSDEETRNTILDKYGILFQGAALFDSMNIFDNVAFGLRRKGLEEDEIKRTVHEILEEVGLKDVDRKEPSEISGGMQKRVGLARSISMRPEIMLYDEPTTGVDPITGGAVNKLIRQMRESFGITSVVVTHDIKSAYSIADRVAMLYGGQIIFVGTPEEMRSSEDPFVKQFIEGVANGPINVI